MTIADFQKKYHQKLDFLDLELLLAFTLKKPREFVLAHPEKKLTARQAEKFESLAKRRLKHEPFAYLIGHKEFYGLDFFVTPDTLIPRPETEMLVEEADELLRSMLRNKLHNNITLIDVGTGSGNIIVSIAKELKKIYHPQVGENSVSHHKISTLDSRFYGNDNHIFYGLDISKKALAIARHNAKKNNIAKEIKFIQSDLLNYFLKNNFSNFINSKIIILANLPYLSKKIYSATAPDVKKFEPKSALYSANNGLAHYEKLFKQIKIIKSKINQSSNEIVILEISPEQKPLLMKLIKKYFPFSKINFKKDLTGKWRIVLIHL